VALWEDPGRAFIRIEGARAGRVLNGLLSADVEAIGEGECRLSFVLSSRGRPIAVPRVVRRPDAYLLDTSREALPGLLEHFGTYLPPRFASLTLLEDARCLTITGPGASKLVARLGPPDPSILRIDRPDVEGGGYDYLAPEGGEAAESLAAELRSAGAVPATATDWETWRIELGIPVYGREVTLECLPQETGLVDRAVSFDKGCYTGQEVVARIHYRGSVQRHLRGIAAGDPPPQRPPAGTLLRSEDREAGHITSWCDSPRFGPIGLAYVRRAYGPCDSVCMETRPPIECRVRDLPFTLR
jgi:folate-binding protein YgfZ